MADNIKNLDNNEAIKKLDKAAMLEAVAAWPEMLQAALGIVPLVAVRRAKQVKQVVISGMGGSAIAGNIVLDLYAHQLGYPLFVNRDYSLPAFVAKGTALLALSYSGNTEETLAAIKEAEGRGAQIIAITSGGKLKDLAVQAGWPLFVVPAGQQPRAALPYLLGCLLNALGQLGIIELDPQELSEVLLLLPRLREEYSVAKSYRVNPAKQLAHKLLGKLPVVLAGGGYASAGLRLKTQLNENSKASALYNVFPELNHNEIVPWSGLKRSEHNFAVVLLRDKNDPARLQKRIDITKSLIGRELGGISEVWSQGKSSLARLLSLIFFGDLVSVYLAILKRLDPSPVAIIERLKRELSR